MPVTQLFVMVNKGITFIVIIVFLFAAIPYASATGGSLPTVKTPEERLKDEVDKMLAAGHLRPAYYNAQEFYWGRNETITVSRVMSHYFANPAETIYALTRALPYLPSSTQAQLKTYIISEWENYPPTQYTHIGWETGAARETFSIGPRSPDPINAGNGAGYSYGNMTPGNYDAWSGWNFNPFNFYAGWKYAQAFAGDLEGATGQSAHPAEILRQFRLNGNVPEDLPTIAEMVPGFPTQDYLLNRPHVLNAYISGYTGWLNLQQMAGETPDSTIQNWLTTARQKRLDQLSQIDPWEIDGTEAGGFLYLVPELGDYLNQNALANVQKYVYGNANVKGEEYLLPYWFVSRVDESTRVHGFNTFTRHEGSTSQYYDYASLFNAKAFALKESRQELEKYLDVPAVARGDLFYIQNLVSTIEATGGTNPTPTSTNPTPTNQPGSSIQAGTGQAVKGGINPADLPTATEMTTMIDAAVDDAKTTYGVGTPKAILIANNVGGWTELGNKIMQEFGSVPIVVGVGTARETYNVMTEDGFIEQNNRSLAILALGGSAITKVQVAGQYNVGQQSATNYDEDVAAGEGIATDLIPHLDPTKSNIIHLFGPGHNPHHNLILCGLKQKIGNVTGKCDIANPDNPELPGIPPVPSYIKIVGAPGFFNGPSFVNGIQLNGSVTGVLIQGTFEVAAIGLSGTPTTVNVPPLVNTLKQELGGTPDVLFYVPGHPAATTYNAIRQSVLTSLGGTSAIFGNEGGGEWGHLTTNSQPIAVSDHLFMLGLKGISAREPGDVNGDGSVNLTDLSTLLSKFGTSVSPNTGADFNGDGVVNLTDLSMLLANFG